VRATRLTAKWLRRAVRTGWIVAVVALPLLIACDSVRTSLPEQVSGAQTEIYGTFAGVGATLLGFLIAGVTLLAALPSSLPLI
jgi:hypothetical protein